MLFFLLDELANDAKFYSYVKVVWRDLGGASGWGGYFEIWILFWF